MCPKQAYGEGCEMNLYASRHHDGVVVRQNQVWLATDLCHIERMLRFLLGLGKGALVGGGAAYGLWHFGLQSHAWAYLGCAVVGAIVGLVAGAAPWRATTVWTPIVKGLFGAAIGSGLCALTLHFLPDKHFSVPKVGELSIHTASLLALAVGALYGIVVEIDDAPTAAKQ